MLAQLGDVLAEEHPTEAALLCAVRLGIPAAGVVREVLRHRLVGVQPDLGEPQPAGFVLGQGEQSRAASTWLRLATSKSNTTRLSTVPKAPQQRASNRGCWEAK